VEFFTSKNKFVIAQRENLVMFISRRQIIIALLWLCSKIDYQYVT